MAKSLLEAYAKRIQIAESVYGQTHQGQKMPNIKKLTVATCLNNVSRFMNEAFNTSSATQRSDMGNWKRFCLNLVNVALPNLIAFDLVMVSPMTSITGYVAYVEYHTGIKKGQTDADAFLNSPFKLANVDPNYTSDRIVEDVTPGTGAQTAISWTPFVHGVFPVEVNNQTVNYDVKLTTTNASTHEVTVTYAFFNEADKKFYENFNPATSEYSDQITVLDNTKAAYVYDNIIVPQPENELPTIKAEIKNIALLAKARRIAIYYSQIAAFQAQTDYGLDLGDQLAEKAVGQLSYEIDTEIVKLLDTTAGDPDLRLTWSKTLPIGVSKRDHYAGFVEVIELARQIIYDRTQRFAPNYMVCASNLLPVLSLIDSFKAAPAGSINGPYLAGTFGPLKVFISPAMKAGEYVIGVNGDDLMSSVAVYAPYMPIVPTQLLQFADGATSQGFSTMYDLKVLNEEIIVKGKITDTNDD